LFLLLDRKRGRDDNCDGRPQRGKFQKRGGRGGRGRGRGGRKNQDEEFRNVIVTKPNTIDSKTAEIGTIGAEKDREIQLVTNYFRVHQNHRIAMTMYRVDFEPPTESFKFRTSLINSIKHKLGLNVYDSANSVYLMNKLPEKRVVFETTANDGQRIKIQLREAREISPYDGMFLTILNLIINNCMKEMKFIRDGRNHFDHSPIQFANSLRVKVFPGKFSQLLARC
jgi:hypothetical protein